MSIDHAHTMPIHGCIPNQLQSLADELGAAKREIAELRGLLMLSQGLRPLDGPGCDCWRCEILRDIKAVLAR